MLESSLGLIFFLKKSTKKNEKYVYLGITFDGIPKEDSEDCYYHDIATTTIKDDLCRTSCFPSKLVLFYPPSLIIGLK